LVMDTKDKIVGLLLGAQKSAQNLSRELGIRVSAVRDHLEALRTKGVVDSGFIRHGRGRPKKMYWLTEKGLELLPRRYAETLDLLLAEIEAEGHRDHVRRTAVRIAQELSGGSHGHVGPGDAARLLDRLGFKTTHSESNGVHFISSYNCVLRRVALRHPEYLCLGLHTWIIEELVGGRVTLQKCMAYGDQVCVHVIHDTARKTGRHPTLPADT
jgi:predicted ArsR family transcriptional regulator